MRGDEWGRAKETVDREEITKEDGGGVRGITTSS